MPGGTSSTALVVIVGPPSLAGTRTDGTNYGRAASCRLTESSRMIGLASLPLIFLGGWAGYAVRQGAGLAVPLTFLKFSRGFEREADLLGLQYVYKTGYDPTAFIDFFERMEAMEKKKPGTVSALFRSHPNMATRIQLGVATLERRPSRWDEDGRDLG